MKVLIVSDTHGSLKYLKKAVSKTGQFAYLIHCGDAEGQEEEIEEIAGVPCTFVRGNNDWDADTAREEIVTLNGVRIFITHGHLYGIGGGLSMLEEEARAENCRIAVCGHTHRPFIEEGEELTILNPGSLTYPRQEGRQPSYIVLELTDKGDILAVIMYLRRW